MLGIGYCGRYSVSLAFEADIPFDGKKPDEMGEAPTRLAYGRVLPSDWPLEPVVVHRGSSESFSFGADIMARADKFLICPTNEEGPRCLTFSLKGFTAALKAVCPKR
jgi:hypothetical protein